MRARGAIVTAAVLTASLALAATAAADGPTLSTSTPVLQYGANVTLQGSAPGQAGQTVQLLATGCGFTTGVQIGSATVDANGNYSFSVGPALGMTLVAQIGDATSAPVAIAVQPLVQLRRVGTKLFAVDVSVGAGQFFSSRATLERFDPKHKRWLSLASGTLRQNSSLGAVTAVSTATIRAAVKPGTRLRAFVGQATVGACYVPASSPSLTA